MPGQIYAYIGNWDKGGRNPPGSGFGICRYNAGTGELTLLKNVFDGLVVGATCLDARRNILYCSHEHTHLPGHFLGGGGQVHALAIDPESGDLREINRQPAYGSLTSHVAVDSSGRYLIATNHTDRTPVTKVARDASGKYRTALEYDDATTVLFRLGEDGSIGEPCDIHTHTGEGGPLPRQTHPQIHSVMMSPSGRFFVVCDKGDDKVHVFTLDRQGARLELRQSHAAPPGSSPRYSAFHPALPCVYVNHESKAVIGVYRYRDDGDLSLLGHVGVLPDGVADDPSIAQSDIRVHPSGKYLYTLIRGPDCVSAFAIDPHSGGLSRIQTAKLDGKGPRGCAISPDGRFLHLAFLLSREVRTWAIAADGTLSPTGTKIDQANPGNITFFPGAA